MNLEVEEGGGGNDPGGSTEFYAVLATVVLLVLMCCIFFFRSTGKLTCTGVGIGRHTAKKLRRQRKGAVGGKRKESGDSDLNDLKK